MDTYEKKYKALVEAVKTLKETNPSDEGIQNWVNDNVPELIESEDERIRKTLIHIVKGACSKYGIKYRADIEEEKLLAWVEKQGENKKEINSFDVLPGLYKCVHRMFDGTPDGKLLFEVGNIYKCLSKHDRAEFEVSYGHSVYLEDPVVCKHFIPFGCEDDYELVEQNPAWGEEDCNQIETIACHLDNIGNGAMAESLLNIINKYKSCRPQNMWKPSDEQIEALDNALSLAKNCGEESAFDLRTLYEQLKKLKA